MPNPAEQAASTAPLAPFTLTEAQAAASFEIWEDRFRSAPSGFLTADECARMAVADVSTARAIYFLALLREIGGTSTPLAPTTRPPAIGQIWPGMGGVYAGISRGAPGQPSHHLIVSPADVGELRKLQWGARGELVAGADCEWDGFANTLALVNASTEHPAAQACHALTIEGHADFYLPSRRELALCYANTPELFDDEPWYWSSTQFSRYGAWYQYFNDGYQDNYDKSYEGRVRAVRRSIIESFSDSAEGGAS